MITIIIKMSDLRKIHIACQLLHWVSNSDEWIANT